VVSLLIAHDADQALGRRVAGALEGGYTVIAAPFANASATVLVGDVFPESLNIAAPLFVVLPRPARATVSIEGVRAPGEASIETPVLIAPAIEVDGAMGRTVDVSIRLNGRVIDRVTRLAATENDRFLAPLSFVPAALGTAALQVVAAVTGSSTFASADIAVDVVDKRSTVLFFDRRPSWMSTFVRRAIESDRRFAVASRVTTSTHINTTTGHPPLSLDDSVAVEAYDAIVVGAPEALTDRDVTGLDRFLRSRAGGVVLLFDDEVMTGSVLDRLTNVGHWAAFAGDAPVAVRSITSDGGYLRAAELLWPVVVPIGGAAVARDTIHRPIVWRLAVGAGQLTVSGALDAWRYRDTATSEFDRFWRATIADAAASAVSALQIDVASRVITPGASFDVRVTSRAAALTSLGRPARAAVSGTLVGWRGAQQSIRLWPTEEAGTFRGSVRAPSIRGDYRIHATDGVVTADVPVVVMGDARPMAGHDPDILDALMRSHGGRSVPGDKLGELTAALASSVHGDVIPTRWYPMRSGWWIVPLILLLGSEWMWRRRNGLA
jgi:hypothetical protein